MACQEQAFCGWCSLHRKYISRAILGPGMALPPSPGGSMKLGLHGDTERPQALHVCWSSWAASKAMAAELWW